MVPSSPHGPCSSGKTTSTSPRVRGGADGSETTRSVPPVTRSRLTAARPPSTSGSLSGSSRVSRDGVARLEHPAAVGRDADRDDVVRVGVDRGEDAAGGDARDGVLAGATSEDDRDAGLGGRHRDDPSGCLRWLHGRRPDPRPSGSTRHARRHRRPPAARARRAAERPADDGVDVRRRRRPGVRALRQPHLDGVRGRARRARGRPLPQLRLRPGGGGHGLRPGREGRQGGGPAARLPRLGRPARRPRVPRAG